METKIKNIIFYLYLIIFRLSADLCLPLPNWPTSTFFSWSPSPWPLPLTTACSVARRSTGQSSTWCSTRWEHTTQRLPSSATRSSRPRSAASPRLIPRLRFWESGEFYQGTIRKWRNLICSVTQNLFYLPFKWCCREIALGDINRQSPINKNHVVSYLKQQ